MFRLTSVRNNKQSDGFTAEAQRLRREAQRKISAKLCEKLCASAVKISYFQIAIENKVVLI